MLSGLTACGDKPPASPNLDRNNLMQLVFPTWRPADNQHRVSVTAAWAPEGPLGDKESKDPTAVSLDIEPIHVVRLSPARAVMLTAATAVMADGELMDSHASSGLIGAYWFKEEDGKWYPDGRQDEAAWNGFMGNVGEMTIVKLDPAKFGLMVEAGSCWQGYCGNWGNLFALEERQVTSLLEHSIPLFANNEGAVESCSALLNVKPGQVVKRTEEQESRNTCYRVETKWQFKPRKNGMADLMLNFDGEEERRRVVHVEETEEPDGNEAYQVELSVENVTGKQVYRFRNGHYVSVSGKNLVPEF